MAHKNPRSEFISMLKTEVNYAENILSILNKEAIVLATRDVDAIKSIIQDKLKAISLFEDEVMHRDELLSTLNLPSGKAGIEQLLSKIAKHDDEEVLLLWDQLQNLALKCQNQNKINEGVVALSQRHVERALSILKGHDENDSYYGPKGSPKKIKKTHSLLKL